MSHNPVLDKIVLGLIPEKTASILDLGCGYGGLALRLRVQNEFTGIIDGLDIFKPWVKQLSKLNLYNHVFHGDILELDTVPLEEYDLIVCLETVEHVSREDGLRIIEELKERSRNVIISTPCTTCKKIDVRHRRGKHSTGNLAMKHKSGYTPNDFLGFDIKLAGVLEIPRCFLPLYHLRARLIGGSVVTQNIVAYILEGEKTS